MERRVINILNSKEERRTFKFLPDYEGILLYGYDPLCEVVRNKDGEIQGVSFNNGPTIYIGDSVYFQERGRFRILDILNDPSCDRPNCYFMRVIKIAHGEKERKQED